MIATEKFLGVRPAQHVTFMVIASPAGAYFSKGVKPITLWLTTDYTRAGRGGMGAAKTGGNYASSLSPSRRRPAQGCDQVVFLDAQEGQYVEELGGMNMYFVYADGRIVTPRARHDPRGHHPLQHHRARRQAGPPGRGAQVLHRRVARRRRPAARSSRSSRAAPPPSSRRSARCSGTAARSGAAAATPAS